MTQKNGQFSFSDLNNFFRNVDYQDFVKNHDFYLHQPMLNIERDTEEFNTYLSELIKMNRGDLFRFFTDTPERKCGNIFYLYYAIKYHDADTIQHLLCPAIYKKFAALEDEPRRRQIKQTLEKLIPFSPNLAAELLKGLHGAGALKNASFFTNFLETVERQGLNFIKAYYECGYEIDKRVIPELIAKAASLGDEDTMDFLAQQFPDPFKNNSIQARYILSALRQNHVACFKKLFDLGYIPDLEQKFVQDNIFSATSVDMIEFMLGKGYPLPQDQEKMVASRKNYFVRSFLERQYLYQELNQKKPGFSDQDISFLKQQDLAHLRKYQTLPSGRKGRGITLASLAGEFNIVANAAARHKYPAPFNWKDLHGFDDKLKMRPIDCLMAYNQGHLVFNPAIWKDDTEMLEKIWESIIPRERKSVYQKAYQNCKNLMFFKTTPPEAAPKKTIRRRPPPSR